MLFYPTQLGISRDTFFCAGSVHQKWFPDCHTPKKIFPKDSDIQRNRKFGHGRECFAPPSPYLWGCSKSMKFGSGAKQLEVRRTKNINTRHIQDMQKMQNIAKEVKAWIWRTVFSYRLVYIKIIQTNSCWDRKEKGNFLEDIKCFRNYALLKVWLV